jgi:hypothetical protein
MPAADCGAVLKSARTPERAPYLLQYCTAVTVVRGCEKTQDKVEDNEKLCDVHPVEFINQ